MNKLIKFIVRVYRRIFVMPNRKILWQIVEKMNGLQETAAESAALTKRLEEQEGTSQKQFEELKQLLRQQMQAARIVGRELDRLSLQNESPSPQGVKVSVIVPVYNVEKYLVECLESIVHQDLDSYEVLCVDDGSTDGSGAIIDEYAAKYPFVRAFHTINRGLGAARNYALRRANGKYVCFVDSDDFLHENVLAELCKEAHSCDLDILCYDGVTVFEEPELERQFSFYKTAYSLSRKKEYSAICDGQELYCQLKANGDHREVAWLHMLRRSFLAKEDLCFPEGMFYEDTVFNFACMMKAQRVSHRRIKAYTYRIRRNSTMTSKQTEKNVFDTFRCYLEFAQLATALLLRDEAARWAKKDLNDLKSATKSRYKQSGLQIEQCQKYFSPVTRALFESMILGKK